MKRAEQPRRATLCLHRRAPRSPRHSRRHSGAGRLFLFHVRSCERVGPRREESLLAHLCSRREILKRPFLRPAPGAWRNCAKPVSRPSFPS